MVSVDADRKISGWSRWLVFVFYYQLGSAGNMCSPQDVQLCSHCLRKRQSYDDLQSYINVKSFTTKWSCFERAFDLSEYSENVCTVSTSAALLT